MTCTTAECGWCGTGKSTGDNCGHRRALGFDPSTAPRTRTQLWRLPPGVDVTDPDGVIERDDIGDQTTGAEPVVDNDPTNDPPVGSSAPEPIDGAGAVSPVATQSGGSSLFRRWTISTQYGWVTARIRPPAVRYRQRKERLDLRFGLRPAARASACGDTLRRIQVLRVDHVSGARSTTNDNPADHCGRSDRVKISRFAALINCDQCNGGTSVQFQKPATGYRNILPCAKRRPTALSGELQAYESSNQVQGRRTRRWRYVTPDNRWVLIGDGDIPSGANWVFVPRDSFAYNNEGPAGMCHAQSKGSPRPTTDPNHSSWPPVCTIHG